MKKRMMISFFLLMATITIHAQQPTSRIDENIKKARERLGDKLLSTADDVIDKYLEAIGGREALLAVKTLMVKGRNSRFGQGDLPLIRYHRQPNDFRQARSPEDKSYILGDGEKVWSVSPSGRQEVSAWWGISLRHARIDGNFIDYQKQGIRYEYLGLEGFETEPFVYYHLRRTFPDGFIEELYFDIETGLLHGVWTTSSPNKDSPMFYYDYRNVGGVRFPHLWMRVHSKTAPPHVFIVEEIRINEDFGKDFFK
ncbi:MAG: hypothetical protein OEW18_06370 [Candidatus Aminicenantes bacterium]|nr:hypothetical protein [Candidatus Aminicenantes bacterium]